MADGADDLFSVPIDGAWTLTDGHTRAFVAHLAGRVLNGAGFEEKWVARCQTVGDDDKTP